MASRIAFWRAGTHWLPRCSAAATSAGNSSRLMRLEAVSAKARSGKVVPVFPKNRAQTKSTQILIDSVLKDQDLGGLERPTPFSLEWQVSSTDERFR
jgi:hypothetical protein